MSTVASIVNFLPQAMVTSTVFASLSHLCGIKFTTHYDDRRAILHTEGRVDGSLYAKISLTCPSVSKEHRKTQTMGHLGDSYLVNYYVAMVQE